MSSSARSASERFAGRVTRSRPASGPALALAIRYYLTEKDTYAPGWAYPRFRRELIEGEGVRVQITIDDAPWEALQREADRQGVSAERLAEHAALYFAAHLETGRIGRSLLDD